MIDKFYDKLYRLSLRWRLYERACSFCSFLKLDGSLVRPLFERLMGSETQLRGVKLRAQEPMHLFMTLDTKYRTSRYDLKKGDVVVDAGAYPGVFTAYAAKKVGPEGKVIAFEPDRKNFRVLEHNIELNDLENVELIKKGLWYEECELPLIHKGVLSNVGTREEGGQVSEKVKVVRLGEELKRLGVEQLDFIKMDIEGAELEALQGMKDLLKEKQPDLAIASYHIRNGGMTYPRVEEILRDISYNAETPPAKVGREKTTFASSSNFSSE